MMKKLVIALLACCTVAMYGCKKEEEVKDQNTIKGVVTFYDADQEETYPAKGAIVRIHNDKAEAYVKQIKAASDGSYSFTELKDGSYQISAIHTETEMFDKPETYKARTASYKVSGKQEEVVNITCKQ